MQREALLTKPAVQITQLSNVREKISHITQAQLGSGTSGLVRIGKLQKKNRGLFEEHQCFLGIENFEGNGAFVRRRVIRCPDRDRNLAVVAGSAIGDQSDRNCLGPFGRGGAHSDTGVNPGGIGVGQFR